MPKFSAKIPDRLSDVVGRVKVLEGLTKGRAIEYLLHLARLKPDFPTENFGSGENMACNLTLSGEYYNIFNMFRANHTPVLLTDKDFFKAALRIGASLYAAGYRLSNKENVLKTELVGPK
jgi:hypothetical protein